MDFCIVIMWSRVHCPQTYCVSEHLDEEGSLKVVKILIDDELSTALSKHAWGTPDNGKTQDHLANMFDRPLRRVRLLNWGDRKDLELLRKRSRIRGRVKVIIQLLCPWKCLGRPPLEERMTSSCSPIQRFFVSSFGFCLILFSVSLFLPFDLWSYYCGGCSAQSSCALARSLRPSFCRVKCGSPFFLNAS